MSRIPHAKRDELSPEQQKIWDHIHAVRTGGGGPYSMLLHVPALAANVAATEDYFRLDSALSDADREIVILAAARELGAHYPWVRHEARARQVGVRTHALSGSPSLVLRIRRRPSRRRIPFGQLRHCPASGPV